MEEYLISLSLTYSFTITKVVDGDAHIKPNISELWIDGQQYWSEPFDGTTIVCPTKSSLFKSPIEDTHQIITYEYKLEGDKVYWSYSLKDLDGKTYDYVYMLCAEMGLLKKPESEANDLIAKAINNLITTNPKSLQDYRGGKKTAIGSLIGMIMKGSSGLDAKVVREKLIEALG